MSLAYFLVALSVCSLFSVSSGCEILPLIFILPLISLQFFSVPTPRLRVSVVIFKMSWLDLTLS